MDIQAYLADRAEPVDALLDRVLPSASEPPRALHAAMRHLLFPGGKRFRPGLACAAAEAVGAAPARAIPMAGAVELVHTYSLLHDDLPCMDDDVERRGQSTAHVAFGEANALLAGDALLAAAFGLLAEGSGPPARRLAALQVLAQAAGARNLVGGQAEDLAFSSNDSDAARVESVHRRKTAALIAAAVRGGAILGGAAESLQVRLGCFGQAVGIAFQIADDLLDRDADQACSLVRVMGAKRAEERANALLAEALTSLEGLGERAEPLRELARYAVWRDR